MKNRMTVLIRVTFGLLMVSAPLYGHHAMSLFDQKRVVSVTGKVTEFVWANPHATMEMDVADQKGNADKWLIEFGPPAQLKRDNGLGPDSFRPGDTVTIAGHPYKDGRKIMRPTKIVLANGKEVANLY